MADFLVVAALAEEIRYVRERLDVIRLQKGAYTYGLIRAAHGIDYDVVLASPDDMNNVAAAAFTQQAISDCTPRYVILCGIAAGIEQFGVLPGDLVVPKVVVDCVTAKVTEVKTSDGPRDEVHHRGKEFFPSTRLHDLVRGIADQPALWSAGIRVDRPAAERAEPRLHCHGAHGAVGQVVASETAEPRRWFVETYRERALSLEMEAYGVALACRRHDTPFIVAKAVQDAGTSAKDDRWRAYAMDASAELDSMTSTR